MASSKTLLPPYRASELFVIARNSSFTYKGKAVDIRQVGRDLGVRHALEGSSRKAGNRVRVTAQLVDCESGSHLWGKATIVNSSTSLRFRKRSRVASFLELRRRGMWMGGVVPLGYQVLDRKLVINEKEAAIVRMIFDSFLKLGSEALLAKLIAADGIRGRRGRPLNKGSLYKLLANRTYIGEVTHKTAVYPGQHEPIISRKVWDKVRSIPQEGPRARADHTRAATPALLKGLLYGPTGSAMSPTHTRRGSKLYRYYVSQSVLKHGPEACPVRRVPAAEIEAAVVDQLRGMLRSHRRYMACRPGPNRRLI